MGFRYRKSIKLGGGVRINISRSGIGYSWGVPGYRVTRTASGKTRTTASIPGTGISYVSEGSKRTPSNITAKNNSFEYTDLKSVKNAEYILKQIQTILTLNEISSVLSFCIILLANPVFLTIGIISILLKLYIQLFVHIDFEYFFDDSSSDVPIKRLEAWKSLKECKNIWYVTHAGRTKSAKNSGGATGTYNRESTIIHTKLPFYLKSNILSYAYKKNKVGAIKYSEIKYDIYATGEICKSAPAKDSKFVKNVWLYTNKDGSPDKRHKDNVQLPVYEMGRIDLSSPSGLDVRIIVSNTDILEKFKTEIESLTN